MRLGSLRHNIDVSAEFSPLSREDEAVAASLASVGHHRQACYFVVQAMEKAIRAKIFSLVNASIEYFRDKNRSHSLDSAVEFLIEIVSTNPTVREQVSRQLNQAVLGDTRYGALHNDLRYPVYFKRNNSHSVLTVSASDYQTFTVSR
jgi:HEPN domain-containing protein